VRQEDLDEQEACPPPGRPNPHPPLLTENIMSGMMMRGAIKSATAMSAKRDASTSPNAIPL
jgi:hypothetical protein